MASVLFVCLGNICRSPMAEAIFLHQIQEAGLGDVIRADSAGTGGWHEGEKPDHRTRAVLEAEGIQWASRARQIRNTDFTEFDHIVAMDRSNYANLEPHVRPGQLSMMLSWDPKARLSEVPDPYYGTTEDFERCFKLLKPACLGLLANLR